MLLRPPPTLSLSFLRPWPRTRQLSSQAKLAETAFTPAEEPKDPHAPYSHVASTSSAVFPPILPPRPSSDFKSRTPRQENPQLTTQLPSADAPLPISSPTAADAPTNPSSAPDTRARPTTPLPPASEPYPLESHLPDPPPTPSPRLAPTDALPNTEPGLYHFLWAARRTARTSTDAATLATIHGHPSLRTLTSSRTYGQVLLLALACSDWALVREVLAEMRERSVAWDELICRTMLVAYLKRGDAVRVKDVLREMRMAGLREPLTYVNWRRDLGDQSRGKGDSWKVWRRRPGPSGLARDSSQVGAAERARASSARASAARPAGTETSFTRFTDADTRIRRTPTFVPSDVGRISNFDVTVLVESLVQDARYSKALAVAETWLAFNRPPAPEPAPPPPPPLPSFITSHPRTPNLTAFNGPRTPTSPLPPPPRRPSISPQVRAYNGAAIILLNILLKVLFVNNLTLAPIKDFIEYFIEHHSLTPSCRIVPNDVTLSTLLKPYLHRSSTFDLEFTRTSNLVNWFGTEFGLPPTPRSLPRVFAPVPQELIDEVYRTEPEQLPVCHVDPTIAWALLRVANIDRERRGAHDPRVSAWWDGLVKRGHGWDRSALRKEVMRAVRNGVLAKRSLGTIQEVPRRKGQAGE